MSYKLHQFWLNVPDKDVIKLLKVYTLLSQEEIAVLEEGLSKAPEKRLAQKKLADAVCTLTHGEEACIEAKKLAAAFFGGSLRELSSNQLLELFAEAPRSFISQEKVAETDLLTLLSSTVSKSKSEAKRLIASGGAYLDNEKIIDGSVKLTESAILDKKIITLRSGKKNYHVVILKDLT
jgi:tyrosyl-tRNA synthetase